MDIPSSCRQPLMTGGRRILASRKTLQGIIAKTMGLASHEPICHAPSTSRVSLPGHYQGSVEALLVETRPAMMFPQGKPASDLSETAQHARPVHGTHLKDGSRLTISTFPASRSNIGEH